MLCCITAVSMVLGLRLYTRFVYRLAMYQVLGSLFWSLSCSLVLLQLNYDPNSETSRVGCYTVAFLLEYSMGVKLLFTLWLTFHLFCYVIFLKNMTRLEWLYIVSSVFSPACVVWIPFVHHNYGIAGAWCFIRIWKNNCATKKNQEGIVETFALSDGPIVATLTLNALAIFIMVVVMLRRAYRSNDTESQPLLPERDKVNRKVLRQLLPLLAYPVIFFTLMLFPLINRLYDATGNSTGFVLIVTQGATIGIMGFFAGLALIMHVCCLKFLKKSNSPKATKQSDCLASQNPSSSYANLSTTQTRFSLPRESVIDENLHHSIGI